MLTVGFIGGGRVTRILLGGWARAGAYPARVLVNDPDDKAIDALSAAGHVVERVSAREAAQADVVFVALHPPAMSSVLAGLKGALRGDAVLVSLAPKVPLRALADAVGTPRVARMIPNAPSLIGQGYNPVAYGQGLDAKARAELSRLFAAWGAAPEVKEDELEAYAILTGMGPTYFWFQCQALRELATGFGLSPADADTALRAMLAGTVATLLDGGLTPAATMDLVPVKPIAEIEPTVDSAYRRLLPALHAKIQPAVAV